MASLLEGALAQTIGKAMGGLFYAATVTRIVPGSGPSHNPGPSTQVQYGCKALVEDYATGERDGTIIQINDRRIIVLATTLAVVPKPGDLVTIRGATYTVVPPVTADPALATYNLNARA